MSALVVGVKEQVGLEKVHFLLHVVGQIASLLELSNRVGLVVGALVRVTQSGCQLRLRFGFQRCLHNVMRAKAFFAIGGDLSNLCLEVLAEGREVGVPSHHGNLDGFTLFFGCAILSLAHALVRNGQLCGSIT